MFFKRLTPVFSSILAPDSRNSWFRPEPGIAVCVPVPGARALYVFRLRLQTEFRARVTLYSRKINNFQKTL